MHCGVLDVETGQWRKLSPPPLHVRRVRFKSVCVNGSIYWLYTWWRGYKLLAFDLHKEAFHDVPSFPCEWITTRETEIVNLEDRLAIAKTEQVGLEWILEILSMDADEERWSKTYSIRLAHGVVCNPSTYFTPLAVSKQGNLVFFDNHKRLFKYYPDSDDEVRCLSTDIRVISLSLENLVPLPLNSSNTYPDPVPDDPTYSTSKCSLHPEPTGILSELWQLMNAHPHIVSIFLLFLCLVLVGLTWRYSL